MVLADAVAASVNLSFSASSSSTCSLKPTQCGCRSMSSAVRLVTSTAWATAVGEAVSPAGTAGPGGTSSSLLELDDDELLLESLLARAGSPLFHPPLPQERAVHPRWQASQP